MVHSSRSSRSTAQGTPSLNVYNKLVTGWGKYTGPNLRLQANVSLVEELPEVFRVNQGVLGNDDVMPIDDMAFSLGPATYKGFEGLLSDVDEGVKVELKESITKRRAN